ncbi:MAG: radical SAM protein [Phycisphaerae bacterium]
MKPRELQRRARTLWTLFTARTPVYVILYLTSRCNYRCPMCFYLNEIEDPEKSEITLPELDRLSRSIGPLIQLSLTGGEPFLRHDIPDVVDIFARNNRVQYVTIPTNGSLTDRVVQTVDRLVTDYPGVTFRIPVSLDGFPEDHDRIRARKSFASLRDTVAALSRLRRRVDNLVLDINTCYSTLNEGKVDGLVDWVGRQFDVDNHTVTYVRGNADERTKDPSTAEYARIVEDLRRRPVSRESRPFSSLLRAVTDYQRDIIRWTLRDDRMYVPCVAGRKLIIINEKGEVLPCEILNERLGSLHDHAYDVRRLLASPQAKGVVQWIRDTRCHCTFECALATSVIFHKASYPRLLWRALRAWLHERPSADVVRPDQRAATPAKLIPLLPKVVD